MPNWNTISISGYHIREAGSTASQEIAFTIADGIAYVEAAIKAGLNLSTEQAGNGFTNPRTVMHAGIFAEHTINNRINLHPELLFSMQGGKYSTGSTKYTDRLSYITLPLMVPCWANAPAPVRRDATIKSSLTIRIKFNIKV